jgi:aryl-alcohol dehydrogenase-like predicted oxidoreductase
VKYRTIGTDPKTRREVSVLSLGAMRFGTTTDEATSLDLDLTAEQRARLDAAR